MTRPTACLLSMAIVVSAWLGCARAQEAEAKKRKVNKTNEEWAKVLTREQFMVCRQKATEPAFSGKLVNNHAKGVYHCVACDAELFSSRNKFDSGTGWPSFDRPIKPANIDRANDLSEAEARIEVMCNDCGAHLGHVFDDGPTNTGLRYCINSISLKFVPDAKEAEKAKAKAKTKAKARSKTKGKSKTKPAEPVEKPDDSTEPAAPKDTPKASDSSP